jgi:hypothetical protein
MKKTQAIVVLFLFLMLSVSLATRLPNAHANAISEFMAVYSRNIPVINGYLNSSEWSDASEYRVNLINASGPGEVEIWLYFKHNDTHIFIGLLVWEITDHITDQFTICFDEGDDGSHGSGTRDGVLTPNQEDVKSCTSGATVTLRDGCYKDSSFYTYNTEIDFDAYAVHENDHVTEEWEIEHWEGLTSVDDHWECEFAIPFVGNDSGMIDVSDLNCTVADTVGIKFQYFYQPATNFYYPMGDQYVIGNYTALSLLPSPTIESCNETGTQKDSFNLGETVYLNGSGYLPSTTYDLYVVEDADWTDQMTIPARVPDTAINVTSDVSGKITPTAVWSDPQTAGKYDVVVDVNGNGVYDAGVDAIDDNDVSVTAGFLIPEFTATLVLFLSMIMTLLAAVVNENKLTIRKNREY